jgi:2-polyprenyl-3-methyl-5-hydroxy-6-metoxy-1,4-benzoquinol methylase
MDAAAYEMMARNEDRHWWWSGRRAILGSILDDLRARGALPLGTLYDLGCGVGSNLAVLGRYGDALGLDGSALAVDAAHALGRTNVRYADLARGLEAISDIPAASGAVVLMADVLEHLQNPTTILKECHKLLNPEGEIVISIPNVAHFSNRLGLLFGMWNYGEKGILDKTHLRFYTKSSFQKEIQDCGFFIKQSMSTPIPLEALFPRMNQHLFKFLDFVFYYPTLIHPKLFGYQLLFVISPVD